MEIELLKSSNITGGQAGYPKWEKLIRTARLSSPPTTLHFRRAMAYKEQAQLTQEACNVLIARLDTHKASCEAMEQELLQRHSQKKILEAAASGSSSTLILKKLATQGRDIVDVSSCVALRAGIACEDNEEDDDEEEEKAVMSGNKLSESESESDDDDDEVDDLRREHQQAAARKSLVRHAIKGMY